jgi:hypothetical protein
VYIGMGRKIRTHYKTYTFFSGSHLQGGPPDALRLSRKYPLQIRNTDQTFQPPFEVLEEEHQWPRHDNTNIDVYNIRLVDTRHPNTLTLVKCPIIKPLIAD